MLKWLIRNRLTAFERRYGYDTTYVREILAADSRAFSAFARIQGMSTYRRDVPRDAYFAAKLIGTLAEDCGPCTQLMVAMALEAGTEPRMISAILDGRFDAMSEDVYLAVQFARAVLAHVPDADAHRAEIVKRWGPRALVSLSFGLSMARLYPTLKYALGYGMACERIVVPGRAVHMVRGAA